jgi:hypothetical protein
MINKRIGYYKAVFIDFDDTLCIHNRHAESETAYNMGVISGKYAWQDCLPNDQMRKFMRIQQEKCVPMYLISAVSSAIHSSAKMEWVRDNYGVELQNFCVGKRKFKVKMIQWFSEVNNIELDKILIIDDCCETLYEAEKAGIHACSPMEIVNLFPTLL